MGRKKRTRDGRRREKGAKRARERSTGRDAAERRDRHGRDSERSTQGPYEAGYAAMPSAEMPTPGVIPGTPTLDELPDGWETPRSKHRSMAARGYGVEAQYHIQRAVEGVGADPHELPDVVLDVLASGGGQPLEPSIQRTFEERMDADFSDVRIHTGAAAANAADAIDARAFTCGNAIVFNQGAYDPESKEGQHLLAHELAHVKQQTGASISMLPQEDAEPEIDPDPQLEREAEQAAEDALSGDEPLIVNRLGTDVHVQRHPESGDFGQVRQDADEHDQSELESLYASLDGSRRDALDHIREDDELWASWQATVETDVIQNEIEASGWDVIENALDRYHRNIVQQGHEPVTFMTGKAANEWYLDLNPEDEPPHQPECIAITFEPGSEDTLYRVTTEGFPAGSFVAREEAFRSKESREQVMDSFALKEGWGEYTKIATFSLDGSEKGQIVISTAAPVTDDSDTVVSERGSAVARQGGIEQYWLTERFDDDKFEMLDEPHDDLETFLEEHQ